MTETHGNSSASIFVTVLAWVLIVFTSLGVITSLMQNVMISVMFPALEQQLPEAEQLPGEGLLMLRTLALSMLCIAGFLLFAAWSLLKRRNWARKTFVVVFVLATVWCGAVFLIVGVGMGVFNSLSMPPSSPEFTSAVIAEFRVVAAMFGIVAAGFGVLFFWLMRRLRAPDVRAEFVAQSSGVSQEN